MPPRPIEPPQAEIPLLARERGLSGLCRVSVEIDSNGLPLAVKIVRCTSDIFEENSLAAVRKSKFRPAMRNGVPVAIKTVIDINYRMDPSSFDGTPARVRYQFFSPPGLKSLDPGPDGIYPFSKSIEPPEMVRFSDVGLGQATMSFSGVASCKLLLTLDEKGKPHDASVLSCSERVLEQPAVNSLMRSKFKAAKLNGKDIPVRMLVLLVDEGFYGNDPIHGAN